MGAEGAALAAAAGAEETNLERLPGQTAQHRRLKPRTVRRSFPPQPAGGTPTADPLPANAVIQEMRRPVDYNQVTRRYVHNPMTYLRVAQHWNVHIHRISGPDVNQVLLHRNSLVMISFSVATDLTAKIEDIADIQGNSLEYIAPATDCLAALTIYTREALHSMTVFHLNLGNMYVGWGDLIDTGHRRG